MNFQVSFPYLYTVIGLNWRGVEKSEIRVPASVVLSVVLGFFEVKTYNNTKTLLTFLTVVAFAVVVQEQ